MTNPIDRIIAGLQPDPRTARKRNEEYRMGWLNTAAEQSLIERAAEARDISVNAFSRRAVVAMACATLGIDYYEFMHDQKAGPVRSFKPFPKVNGFGKESEVRGKVQGSENGRGCGLWRIQGLS